MTRSSGQRFSVESTSVVSEVGSNRTLSGSVCCARSAVAYFQPAGRRT